MPVSTTSCFSLGLAEKIWKMQKDAKLFDSIVAVVVVVEVVVVVVAGDGWKR